MLFRDINFYLLLGGALLPPMGWFRDEPQMLQWFVCVFVALCLLAVDIVGWGWRKSEDGNGGGSKQASRLTALSTAAAVAVIVECAYALFIGFPYHRPLCGSLPNPTILAINICVLLPLAAAGWETGGRHHRWLCVAACALALPTVILSQCRAGMLCLALFAALLTVSRLTGRRSSGRWPLGRRILGSRSSRSLRWILPSAAVIALAALLVFSPFKHDSTSGRWFIARNTVELIRQRPVLGYGPGGFRRVYMPHQADYFRTHPDSPYAALADDIAHPLNEFLFVWVDFGLPGLLLLLAAIAFPAVVFLRRTSSPDKTPEHVPLALLAAITLFSLLSYPLQCPLPCLALLMLNARAFRVVRFEVRGGRL